MTMLNTGHFYFYPSNRLVGVVNDTSTVLALLHNLSASGVAKGDVTVLTGEDGQRWLDPEGERHGPLGRLVRWSEGLTDEHTEVRQYAAEIADGGFVVATHIQRHATTFGAVLVAYRQVGARLLRYYGPAMIEDEPV